MSALFSASIRSPPLVGRQENAVLRHPVEHHILARMEGTLFDPGGKARSERLAVGKLEFVLPDRSHAQYGAGAGAKLHPPEHARRSATHHRSEPYVLGADDEGRLAPRLERGAFWGGARHPHGPARRGQDQVASYPLQHTVEDVRLTDEPCHEQGSGVLVQVV